jgi:hypothetical protein
LSELQPTDITNGSGFYARIVETIADRGVILVQQLREILNRSIRFPVSDAGGFAVDLPTATARANKALIFDSDGNVDVSVDNYVDR